MHNKVLLVTSIYPPQSGGPAIFTKRFGDWLKNKGFEVCTISYQNGFSKKSNNFIFIDLDSSRIISFIKFIIAIKRNSDKNDLILANGAFLETYIACAFSKRKFIAKIPGDQAWEVSKNRGWTRSNIENFQLEKINLRIYILRILRNRAFKKARFVVSPSDQLRNFLIKWGISNEKTEIIFNCVDPVQFNLNSSIAKKYDLVTVCRLVPWKGLEELIKCSKSLNLSLVIIGDGPLRSHLESMVQYEGNKVTFMGNLSNYQVSQVLNQSKIFVLNSEFEATSYALIEAKMSGTPVIARENNGSVTVVRNGVDGLLVSNSDRLDESIRLLVYNNSLLAKFSREARKDALIRFNQEVNFSKILNILEG